jgi:ubiquinone/menaquinone biosynthesis C-methylase UbiE
MLEPGREDSLLDVGTGTAALLAELARAPDPLETAIGVDRSARMLARAPRLPTGWRLVEGDAAELPFPDGSFDLVTASYLLHFMDPATRSRVIAEARRVLTPGGRLGVITVAPPAGRISALLSAPIRSLARRSEGVLAGLRPLDPTPELRAEGLRPLELRRVRIGYPSLCVVCSRGD